MMKARYKQLAFAFIILILLSAIAVFFVVRGRKASVDADAASETETITETICGLTEHTHDESCLAETEPVCGLEGVIHEHTDECYKETKALICDQEDCIITLQMGTVEEVIEEESTGMSDIEENSDEESFKEASDNEISSEEPSDEVPSEEASNENSSVEIPAETSHIHTDECYELTKELACDKEGELHLHTDECFGEPVYICGLEEHTHDEKCIPDIAVMADTEEFVAQYDLSIYHMYYGNHDRLQCIITAPEGVSVNNKIIFNDNCNAIFKFKDYGTYDVFVKTELYDAADLEPDNREMHVVFTVTESGVKYATRMEIDGEKVGVQDRFVHVGKMPSVWSSSTWKKAGEMADAMTLEELVGQLFLVHYPGDGSGTAEEANAIIDSYHVGGFIAFAPMFENSTPDLVKAKINAVQEHSKIPLFFSIDEEGGNVVRASKYPAFRDTPFPKQKDLWSTTAVYDDAAEKSRFLYNLGFNLNHAPVADTATSGGFIYERTYGGDPIYNEQRVSWAVKGHQDNDVAVTVKHFPGYGNTVSDTHQGTAVNSDSLMQLKYYDMIPFYSAMWNAGTRGIMVTHNVYEAFGDGLPASLSPAIMNYLRETLRYDGIIMTDDLKMKAVTNVTGDGQASLCAIKAGADMVITDQPGKDIPVILAAVESGSISKEDIYTHAKRVLAWKIDKGVIESTEDDYEAMAQFNDIVKYGSFADMWNYVASRGSGTVTLFKDCTFTGNASAGEDDDIILNLNGHNLHFKGDYSYIHLSRAEAKVTVKDETDGVANKPIISERQVTETDRSNASYSSNTHILIYYTYADDGIITEHIADYSGCGSITGDSDNIFIQDWGELVLDGIFMQNIKGSCVYVRKVQRSPVTTIKNCTFAGCLSKSEDKAVVHIYNGDIFNDYNAPVVNISGSIFAANKTNAVSVISGIANISNTVFSGNNAELAVLRTINGRISLYEGVLITDNSSKTGAIHIQELGNVTIDKSKIFNNHGLAGGIWSENGKLNLTDASILRNTATDNGGGLCLINSPLVDVTGTIISGNTAKTGGGIYMEGSTNVSLFNTTITSNKAQSAGGIYHNGATLSMEDMNYIRKNLVNGERNNVYLAPGRIINLTGSLSSNSNIGIMTEELPADESGLIVITADSPVYTMQSSMVSSDRARYHTETVDSTIVLKEGDTDDSVNSFEGLLIQYYANTNRLSRTGNNDRKLEIIDTSGGVLPTYATPPQTKYMYLEEDGTPSMTTELMPIYYQKNVIDESDWDIQAHNKFSQYRNDYELLEIWVTDDSEKMMSNDSADWTIYPYSDSLSFVTGEAQDENQIHVESGYVIRYVGRTTEATKEINAVFYDYDITNGFIYKSQGDAWNDQRRMPTSNQTERDKNWSTSYAKTTKMGINTIENYDLTGNKSVFAFGNANTASGWDTQLFEGYTMNAYNRRPSTFNGVTFGLVKGLDENGHIIWHDKVTAPNLFNEGDAIGKTTLPDQTLGFIKTGETYTLSYVAGTNATELETFGHPGNYTHIWTNDFWPLDDMGTFGTDGHDLKFGSSNKKDFRKSAFESGKAMLFPVSDDGLDHNSYFGMQFSVKFTVNPDYIGPMEYLFFGDDDMWVFLDGKLISDIGGVHRSCGSFVNLWDYIKPGSSGQHEMSFYYLERGASGSTCWMQFNLPNIESSIDDISFPTDLKISKQVEGIETDEEFEFNLLFTDAEGNEVDGEFSYTGSKNGTISSGGTIMLADGESVTIRGIPAGTIYTVTETEYENYTVESIDASGVITETSGTIGDGAKLVKFVNTYKGHMMPATGGHGTWMYIMSGVMALGFGFLLMTRRKKQR